MTGETNVVAKGKERIVVVPVILEITQVDAEVTVGVRIHVRDPAVTVRLYAEPALYDTPPIPPRAAPATLCILFRAVCPIAHHTDFMIFFAQGGTHPQGLPNWSLADSLYEISMA